MAATANITPPELEELVLTEVKQTGKKLGVGAYGRVEEVEIPGAKVAAKQLHSELVQLSSQEEIQKWTSDFVEECKLMSQLRHPNIVQFLGVCYLPGSPIPVLLMEKLQTNLDTLLETTPDIPLDIKVHLLIGICQGVVYLHSRSPPIAHRDLTARNILIDSGLTAKIADLGVARMVNIQPGQLAATMTRAPGNGLYMPPEAIQEDRYNTSIDIFSFGVISLFTVTQTFPADLKPPTYRNHITGNIVGRSEIERREDYVRSMKSTIGEKHKLLKLTLACLEYRSNKRPSAVEVLKQLEEIERLIPDKCEETKLDVVRKAYQFQEEHDRQIRELTHEKAVFLNQFITEMELKRSENELKVSELESNIRELQDIIDNLRKEKKHLIKHITEGKTELKAESSEDDKACLESGEFTNNDSLAELASEHSNTESPICKTEQINELEETMSDGVEPTSEHSGSTKDKTAESPLDSDRDTQQPQDIAESLPDSMSEWEQSTTSEYEASSKPDFSSSIISDWRRCSNIPQGVYLYGQPVTLNGKLYASAMQSFASGAVLEYTPSSDEWSFLPDPSVCNFTLATLNSKLLVVGGASTSSGRVMETILAFDESTQEWETLSFELLQPLTVPLVTEFRDQLIVAGGDDATDTLTTDVNVYNAKTDKWSPLKCLPHDDHFKQVLNEYTLYLVGQQESKCFQRTDIRIFIYKSARKSKIWESLPEVTNYHSTLVVFGNHLLTVGGSVDENAKFPSCTIELYNPSKKKWRHVSDLPEPMAKCCCAVISKELLILGGAGNNSVYAAELKIPTKPFLKIPIFK